MARRAMAPGWLRPAVCGTYRKDVGSYAAFEVVDTLQLKFRDSLTEMDSRYPLSRAQASRE